MWLRKGGREPIYASRLSHRVVLPLSALMGTGILRARWNGTRIHLAEIEVGIALADLLVRQLEPGQARGGCRYPTPQSWTRDPGRDSCVGTRRGASPFQRDPRIGHGPICHCLQPGMRSDRV
jgi:hypothetical protein